MFLYTEYSSRFGDSPIMESQHVNDQCDAHSLAVHHDVHKDSTNKNMIQMDKCEELSEQQEKTMEAKSSDGKSSEGKSSEGKSSEAKSSDAESSKAKSSKVKNQLIQFILYISSKNRK